MLTNQQAMEMFASDDLAGLGLAADAMRSNLHPEGIVTYQIDRNINYTNYCTEYCSFCNFYKPMKSGQGYILSKETIYDKIQETFDLGGTGVLMQGGLNSDLKIEWYEDLLSSIKRRFPAIHLHCFSAPEIGCIAEVSGLSIYDTIARLRDSGLDSIPGGGAEILDDEVRQRISRLKCTTEDWMTVHRTAHALGMRTTATMMFGCGELIEHRVKHFERVRQLQDETGGFTAFIPWMFQREGTSLGRFVKQEATAVDYLKTLAISRVFLHNFDNVQASWLTPGIQLGQVALRFGGNDLGSILIEENVVSTAGCTNKTNEEELRQTIRDAGFRPVKRDTLYRTFYIQ